MNFQRQIFILYFTIIYSNLLYSTFVNGIRFEKRTDSLLKRCICHTKTITLSVGSGQTRTVFSPNFPRPYCSNVDCIWQINVKEPKSLNLPVRIRFVAKNLDLRNGRDFISFDENVKQANAPMAQNIWQQSKYNCTGNTELCVFESSNEQLIIRFIADYGVHDHYGFQGTVSLIEQLPLTNSESEFAETTSTSIWIYILLFILLLFVAIIFIIIIKRYTSQSNRKSKLPTNSPKTGKSDSSRLLG